MHNIELYHHGVKGMKWGIVRSVAKGAYKSYKGAQKHGDNVLEKRAQRSDFRSQYHASKGHKIRAKHYDKQAFKTRDKRFDDIETLTAGIKDLGTKATTVVRVAQVGSAVAQGMLNRHMDNKDRKHARKVNAEMTEMYNTGKLKY